MRPRDLEFWLLNLSFISMLDLEMALVTFGPRNMAG